MALEGQAPGRGARPSHTPLPSPEPASLTFLWSWARPHRAGKSPPTYTRPAEDKPWGQRTDAPCPAGLRHSLRCSGVATGNCFFLRGPHARECGKRARPGPLRHAGCRTPVVAGADGGDVAWLPRLGPWFPRVPTCRLNVAQKGTM